MNKNLRVYVTVEGPLGSGKTYVIEELRKVLVENGFVNFNHLDEAVKGTIQVMIASKPVSRTYPPKP